MEGGGTAHHLNGGERPGSVPQAPHCSVSVLPRTHDVTHQNPIAFDTTPEFQDSIALFSVAVPAGDARDFPPNPKGDTMRGAVADDFTGATDLAGNWRSCGLRTAVLLGAPDLARASGLKTYDAVVVARSPYRPQAGTA